MGASLPPVTTLAVHSFLGQVARTHYAAVASELARLTGVELEPLRGPAAVVEPLVGHDNHMHVRIYPAG